MTASQQQFEIFLEMTAAATDALVGRAAAAGQPTLAVAVKIGALSAKMVALAATLWVTCDAATQCQISTQMATVTT